MHVTPAAASAKMQHVDSKLALLCLAMAVFGQEQICARSNELRMEADGKQ